MANWGPGVNQLDTSQTGDGKRSGFNKVKNSIADLYNKLNTLRVLRSSQVEPADIIEKEIWYNESTLSLMRRGPAGSYPVSIGIVVNIRTPFGICPGAKGDDINDDSASINAVIDYVRTKGGGTILVPDGVYKTLSPIKKTGNAIRIVGTGPNAVFKGYGAINVLEIGDGVAATTTGSIEDISISAGDGSVLRGIYGNRCPWYTFKNVTVFGDTVGCTSAGVEFVDSWGCEISQMFISDVAGKGFDSGANFNAGKISRLTAQRCGGDPITLTGFAIQCDTPDIETCPDGNGLVLDSVNCCKIITPYIENVKRPIIIKGSSQMVAIDKFYINGVSLPEFVGIDIIGSANIEVNGYFNFVAADGIGIRGDTVSNRIDVGQIFTENFLGTLTSIANQGNYEITGLGGRETHKVHTFKETVNIEKELASTGAEIRVVKPIQLQNKLSFSKALFNISSGGTYSFKYTPGANCPFLVKVMFVFNRQFDATSTSFVEYALSGYFDGTTIYGATSTLVTSAGTAAAGVTMSTPTVTSGKLTATVNNATGAQITVNMFADVIEADPTNPII